MTKKTQAEVNYRHSAPSSHEYCEVCKMYIEPKTWSDVPGCTSVEQPIFSEGLCRIFEPEPDDDDEDED